MAFEINNSDNLKTLKDFIANNDKAPKEIQENSTLLFENSNTGNNENIIETVKENPTDTIYNKIINDTQKEISNDNKTLITLEGFKRINKDNETIERLNAEIKGFIAANSNKVGDKKMDLAKEFAKKAQPFSPAKDFAKYNSQKTAKRLFKDYEEEKNNSPAQKYYNQIPENLKNDSYSSYSIIDDTHVAYEHGGSKSTVALDFQGNILYYDTLDDKGNYSISKDGKYGKNMDEAGETIANLYKENTNAKVKFGFGVVTITYPDKDEETIIVVNQDGTISSIESHTKAEWDKTKKYLS